MRVVTYEDRVAEITGLKLLLLSLNKTCPGLSVDAYFPGAPKQLQTWTANLPNVCLHTERLDISGFNVKPRVLMAALQGGSDEAIWIDTDVIVAKDIRPLFSPMDREAIAVAEEWFGAPYQGGTYRSESWKLPTKRKLPATANTAVTRVTQSHSDLLRAWDVFVLNEDYVAAQKQHWSQRPTYMMGDQELLTALLEAEPFDKVPIRYLKRGWDIAHCFHRQGYNVYQNAANLLRRNKPYFVHGQGARPWGDYEEFRAHLDISPYTLCALEYADALDEPADWMVPRSRLGRHIRAATKDNPWSSYLPFAFVEELKHQRLIRVWAKQLLGKP